MTKLLPFTGRSFYPVAIFTLILLFGLVSGFLPWLNHAVEAVETKVVSQKAANTSGLPVTLRMLGDPDGYTLKTVKSERQYAFTRPAGWKILPGSVVEVGFQHSPALLPKRSSLNVLVNNRILKTIPLGPDNVTPHKIAVPLPANILKDHNMLTFQVDQHYTYECEDPFSAELWTTLLPETRIHLRYAPQPVTPNLARFPFPFFDPLGYGKTRVGFVAPPQDLSAPSLEALGVLATLLGQQVQWREMTPFLATGSDPLKTDANLILVGTPGENPWIAALKPHLPVPLSAGGKFADPASKASLPPEQGILQVIRNPNHPAKAILVVTGNSPKGVANAAHLLAQNPANRILVGAYAIVKEQHKGPLQPFRAWENFIQEPGTVSFQDLGLETLTSRGITALPIFYRVKKMPDLWIPGKENVALKTVYSYSSQLDPTQSKLEVILNGKSLGNVPLDDRKGKNQAVLTLNIPARDFYTYNNLEYKFHLFPEKFDLCNFVTDVHIWGTLHNTSEVSVPGTVKSPLPDVGLLNDGAFPFTIYQDMTELAVVLPQDPQAVDVETMLQILTRFGRLSSSRTGINLSVHHATTLPEEIRNKSHLVVIGSPDRNSLLKEFQSKMKLLIEKEQAVLEGPLAKLKYSPDQGIVEEVLSPWNESRVALLASGKNPAALERTARLFAQDAWFDRIEPGNLLVVNENGPKSLIFLKKGEARFVLPSEYGGASQLPQWAWILLGFLALLGAFSILRFLFVRSTH